MCLSHVTRYSMSYAVNPIVRAMSRPSNVHVGAAKHCVRYVADTSGFRLNANSDVNCGNHPYNGKLTLSYVIMMCNGPVSLKVCMHGLTAQSTMEAELVVGALAMSEAVFCQNMMSEMGFKENFKCVPLHIDTTSGLYLAGNRTYKSHANHVALTYFAFEIIEEGHTRIHYIPTDKDPTEMNPGFQQPSGAGA